MTKRQAKRIATLHAAIILQTAVDGGLVPSESGWTTATPADDEMLLAAMGQVIEELTNRAVGALGRQAWKRSREAHAHPEAS